ncbi:hypothetical protein [Cupriavidus pampae]|uniref:Transcription factor zinc-finger domain-containing protein n=1 Tax=Cupriavidus pampae TaxID=659251 RepID=A0ABM8XUR3_9BURK|nr:hypothetical protein [Cupriavidus pampae]CAG9184131.1 hypothetical protein LMG32289_05523 [Cupriavidus pampae]
MTNPDGCFLRCGDPDCNEGPFPVTATQCPHCGQALLKPFHPSSQYDAARQACICSDCGLIAHSEGLARVRAYAASGKLDAFAPELAAMLRQPPKGPAPDRLADPLGEQA